MSTLDRTSRMMFGLQALASLLAFRGANALSLPSSLQLKAASYGQSSPASDAHRLLLHDEHEMLRTMEYSIQADIRRMARIVLEQTQPGSDIRSASASSHPSAFRSNRFLQSSLGMDTASLQPVCEAIQNNFVTGQGANETSSSVKCVCTGSTTSSFAISCEFGEPLCSPLGTMCGRPFIGMSVEAYSLFSVTACVYDYQRRGSALNDTCISMEVCADAYTEGQRALLAQDSSSAGSTESSSSSLASVQFCGCTAQYGSKICPSCSVCDSGHGIFMDCSEYNPEVVTPSCHTPDTDLDFSGVTGSMVGFVPNLSGLCTQIESGLQNRVECDCGDAGGGNFNLTCRLADGFCTAKEAGSDLQYCGSMGSTVQFREGSMASVTACSDFRAPADLLQTCVTLDLDPATDEWTSCQATYGGQDCQSCSLCQGGIVEDGVTQRRTGVVLDCTNAGPEWAKVESCQPIESPLSSLEFVPRFVNVPQLPQVSLGEGSGSTSSSGSMSRIASFWATFLLASTATAILLGTC